MRNSECFLTRLEAARFRIRAVAADNTPSQLFSAVASIRTTDDLVVPVDAIPINRPKGRMPSRQFN
jgi:hypothetical protein